MILGPVSLIDCLAFCIFLTPQLIWHVGFFRTTFAVLPMLPFLRKYTRQDKGVLRRDAPPGEPLLTSRLPAISYRAAVSLH